jgi:hypothetical protein
MVKLLQAKQLEYEAFKEVMPECMARKVNKLGEELLEVAIEYFKAANRWTGDEKQASVNEGKTRINKITIE